MCLVKVINTFKTRGPAGEEDVEEEKRGEGGGEERRNECPDNRSFLHVMCRGRT